MQTLTLNLRDDLAAMIVGVAMKHGIPPERLAEDIVEHSLDGEDIRAELQRLRSAMAVVVQTVLMNTGVATEEEAWAWAQKKLLVQVDERMAARADGRSERLRKNVDSTRGAKNAGFLYSGSRQQRARNQEGAMFRKVHNGLAENAEGIQVMFGLEKIVYIAHGKRLSLEDAWGKTGAGEMAHRILLPSKPHWDKPHNAEAVPEEIIQRMQADIRDGIAAFSGKPMDTTFYTSPER